MTQLTTAAVTNTAQVRISLDRCDRCSARALVRAWFGFSMLQFCGHHFAAFESGLRAAASLIVDDRPAN